MMKLQKYECVELPVSSENGRQFQLVSRWDDGSATVVTVQESGWAYAQELADNGQGDNYYIVVDGQEYPSYLYGAPGIDIDAYKKWRFESVLARARRGEEIEITELAVDPRAEEIARNVSPLWRPLYVGRSPQR